VILAPLNKEEREILILYSMGFSHKEIAGIIKKPYATVRWKYRYVLNKLSMAEKEENYERA
jgi:DNA-directed RNA polymerase specialized sigma24 family protein